MYDRFFLLESASVESEFIVCLFLCQRHLQKRLIVPFQYIHFKRDENVKTTQVVLLILFVPKKDDTHLFKIISAPKEHSSSINTLLQKSFRSGWNETLQIIVAVMFRKRCT